MVLLSLVCFILLPINLLGNSLVIVAALLDRPHKPCTYLLINLAIADLCFGVAYLLVAIFSETLPSYDPDVLCKVYGYFTYSTVGVSVLTLAAISLERFYVIVTPLQHYGKISNSTLKLAVAVIWVGTNAAVIPMTLFISGTKSNVQNLRCKIGGSADKIGRIYHPILGTILILCPFLFICYFYSRIIHNLWVKSQQHAVVGANLVILKSRRKLTKLLVVVTAVFSICLLPMAVTRVVDIVHKEKEYFLLNRWTMVLMCVHSSVNPLIYSLNNNGFRSSILKLLNRGRFALRMEKATARVRPLVTTQLHNKRKMTAVSYSVTEEHTKKERFIQQ